MAGRLLINHKVRPKRWAAKDFWHQFDRIWTASPCPFLSRIWRKKEAHRQWIFVFQVFVNWKWHINREGRPRGETLLPILGEIGESSSWGWCIVRDLLWIAVCRSRGEFVVMIWIERGFLSNNPSVVQCKIKRFRILWCSKEDELPLLSGFVELLGGKVKFDSGDGRKGFQTKLTAIFWGMLFLYSAAMFNRV